MEKFQKTADRTLSEAGKSLKQRIILASRLYTNLMKSEVKEKVETSTGYIPGVDKFLDNFIGHYVDSPKFRNSLVVNLCRGYTTKVSGVANPAYATNILHFLLGLAAGGKKRAFEFVSGNLGACSLRHIKRVIAAKRGAAFINLTDDEMLDKILGYIEKIRKRANAPKMRVVVTLGIDATCLVQAFQASRTHGAIVGGASPKH